METTQAVRLAGKEHYNALKNRKEELERVIEEKEAELRRIKLQEAVSYCAETLRHDIRVIRIQVTSLNQSSRTTRHSRSQSRQTRPCHYN